MDKRMLKVLLMISLTSNNTVCSSSKWLQKNNNKWLQKIGGRGGGPRPHTLPWIHLCHHQKTLILMIVTWYWKWVQVSFFAVCPTASHVYFLHKRLNYGEKKKINFFSITCTQKWSRKKTKNRKANEISNYWNKTT